MHIIVKNHRNTAIQLYDRIHGKMSPSEKAAERAVLSEHRSKYNEGRKGMSKNGTMMHIGHIPAKLFAREVAEKGLRGARDPKNLKRLINEHQLRVSGKGQ